MRSAASRTGMLILTWSLIAAAVGGTAAVSGDVPTYRGDAARTGVMPGPGPSGAPEVAWTLQAGAPFMSSPAVVSGIVIAVSTDGVVQTLALATGTPGWTAELGEATDSASPLVVDDLVIVGDLSGVVHALDLASGAERWRTTTDGPVAGAAVAIDDRVIVATESGTAYALDPRSGAAVWQQSLPGGVSRSICAAGGRTFFAISGGLLVALTASDGAIAWTAQVAPGGEGGTPSAAYGLVFAATGLDSPAVENRGVVALDAATGAERWRRASPSGAVLYSPALADGRAYIVAEDSTVIALDAATGVERWSMSTGATNDALPAVWTSTVYVATAKGSLQALDAATGALNWQVAIVGVPYAPVVAGGLVIVGTNAGVLYGFGDPAK